MKNENKPKGNCETPFMSASIYLHKSDSLILSKYAFVRL